MLQQMVHIAPRPGEEIIDTQHLITAVEQPLTEVRANESSSARNEYTPFSQHLQYSSLTPLPVAIESDRRDRVFRIVLSSSSCPTSSGAIARRFSAFRLIRRLASGWCRTIGGAGWTGWISSGRRLVGRLSARVLTARARCHSENAHRPW